MSPTKWSVIIGYVFALIGYVFWLAEAKWAERKLSRLKKALVISGGIIWGLAMLGLAFVDYKIISQQDSLQSLSNSLAALTPPNQRIMSISAAAQFTVPGFTNFPPVDPEVVKKVGGVARFECVGMSQGVQHLLCLQSEQVSSQPGQPVGLGLPTNTDTTTFFMDFHLNTMLSRIGREAQAGLIDKLEAPVLEARFLPDNFEVLTGSVMLSINGTVRKEFPIPPQRKNLRGITCLSTNR